MVDYTPLYPSGVFLVGKSLGVRGANGGKSLPCGHKGGGRDSIDHHTGKARTIGVKVFEM